MARLTAPSEASRLVFRAGTNGQALTSAAGTTVTIYAASTGGALADIQTPAGAAIAGSVLTVDANTLLPDFLLPDSVDTVWGLAAGGSTRFPIYAREDDRLDDLTTRLAGIPATATSKAYVDAGDAAEVTRANGTFDAGTAFVLYVATTGSNVNVGLIASRPKATITAAIAALPAGGGTLLVDEGTYLETVTLPLYPKVVNIYPTGARSATIIQPAAINTPAIQCAGGGAVQEGRIVISVKAHASGSIGGAVLCDGMRSMDLDVQFFSNGTGNFASGFLCSAITTGYVNNLRPVVISQSGPAVVVKTTNGGTAGTNANICSIDRPFVYANTGVTTVLDLGDTTGWSILPGGLIEANPGAIVLVPGNNTKMRGQWIEANAANDIVPAAAGVRSVNAQDVILEDNYHSGSALTIPTGFYGWVIRYAGTFTITDTDGWKLNRQEHAGIGRGVSPWTKKISVGSQSHLNLTASAALSNVGTWSTPQYGTNLLIRFNSSSALNDETVYGVDLPPGTYVLNTTLNLGTDSPIVTVLIDGVPAGTFDMYAASASVTVRTISNIIIGEGQHNVTFRATSKNASSTSYLMRLGLAVFTKTA